MESNAEILLAWSAAPDSISSDATILVLGRQGYETAVRGKNGFVCMVERAGWRSDCGDVSEALPESAPHSARRLVRNPKGAAALASGCRDPGIRTVDRLSLRDHATITSHAGQCGARTRACRVDTRVDAWYLGCTRAGTSAGSARTPATHECVRHEEGANVNEASGLAAIRDAPFAPSRRAPSRSRSRPRERLPEDFTTTKGETSNSTIKVPALLSSQRVYQHNGMVRLLNKLPGICQYDRIRAPASDGLYRRRPPV
jgi:hypothetical protein